VGSFVRECRSIPGSTISGSIDKGLTCTFPATIPGNAVPSGYNFQVCTGTGVVGVVLPHCQMFSHSQEGDAMVTVTPLQFYLHNLVMAYKR
jgi:hypothetical protein